MKYTLVVRQAAAVKAGLVSKVTFADLGFLDYLRGWFFYEGAEIRVVEKQKFVWLHYERAIVELPFLFSPQAQIASRKNQLTALIQKLREAGLVETHKIGRRLFFRLTGLAVQVTQRSERPAQPTTKPAPAVTPAHDVTVTVGQDATVTSSRDEYLPPIIDETGIMESVGKETPPLAPCEGEAESILAFWNSFPELPKAITITRSRVRQIRKRLADPWWREHWRDGIKRIAASDFGKGGGERGWRANFGWFIGEDTLANILEGIYDNRPRPDRTPLPSDVKAQIKAVEELIKSHPANDKCIAYDRDATQEQEEDLRNLFRRRKELVHQLAYLSSTRRQPGDDDSWWTIPLDELQERIRVERHLGNEQVAARLLEIHKARER